MRKALSWKIVVLMFAACCICILTRPALADTTVGDNDSYIIEVDTDNGGAGAFTVNDYDGIDPTVTIINADADTTTLSSTATNVTGTLTVTGTTTTNGIDNGGDGITNAGAVSGVTTLTASGDLSAGSVGSTGTLGVLGLSNLNGINNNSGDIANAGAIAGATTINASGTITGGNLTTGGTLSVTGTSTLTGALTANGGATINNGATIYSGTGTGNSLAVGGTGVNATVGNNSLDIDGTSNTITMVADNDALWTNGRGELVVTPTYAAIGTHAANGEGRGLEITPTETVLSGGTGTTSMTLDDGGATFADVDTGAPITVTGVANASSDYDAVNYKQFKNLRDKAYSGIASVAALAAISTPPDGKNYSIGAGFGNYIGESALALGGKAKLSDGWTLAAGLGYTGDDFTTNAGLTFSW